MYTFVFLLGFTGVFFLYNTSKKAKLSSTGNMEHWLQAHPQKAAYLGIIFLMTMSILLIVLDGLGVGMIKAFLLLMLSASAMVAIAPFQFLKGKHVLLLLVLSILLELLIL